MTSKILLLAAAVALSLGTVAQAQETTRPGAPPPTEETPPTAAPDPAAPPGPAAPSATSTATPSSTTESTWLGATVIDSKGVKVGKIERLVKDGDGAVTAAEVRVRGKAIVLPASTLTLADGNVVSSQTQREIEAAPK